MKQLTRIGMFGVLTGLLLSSCTTVPEQLKGDYAPLTPKTTTQQDLQTPVRWGGVLLETRPEANHTCFEVLAKPLEKSMRPEKSDQADGRFVACKPGFYDPEIFKKGREVTVTGELIHIDVRKVGEYDYQFPVVDIQFMSLWPKRLRPVYYDFYGPYRPYYWHYPYYGRFHYRYPYW